MFEITDQHYRDVAERLLEAIGPSEFFNGSIEIQLDESCSQLRTTLIVRRRPALDPADISQVATQIIDIIPVWWEHHLITPDGERHTDFSWRELKHFLI